MGGSGVRRWYRLGFGLLTLVAIIYQFYDRSTKPNFRPLNFFSFFTIESNIFAAIVLISLALRPPDPLPSPHRDRVRGAATLYLAITGVVYGLLLSGYSDELQTALPWVDTVVHRIMPLVMVADWLLDPPRTRIPLRQALVWLAYPLLFAAYSLIRGPIVDWYPYPFLDPDRAGGYGAVALYLVAIAIGAFLFAWAVVWLGERVRLAVRPTASPA